MARNKKKKPFSLSFVSLSSLSSAVCTAVLSRCTACTALPCLSFSFLCTVPLHCLALAPLSSAGDPVENLNCVDYLPVSPPRNHQPAHVRPPWAQPACAYTIDCTFALEDGAYKATC